MSLSSRKLLSMALPPAPSPAIPPTLLRSAVILSLLTVASACAPRYSRDRMLGVLPPQPPQPLWLGDFRPSGADSALRGAVAVTRSSTPGWSHILISIRGGTPGASYSWRIRSGHCTDSGPTIGPENRYDPLIPFADGTAKAEAVIPDMLSPSAPYSVTVSGQNSANLAPSGCAELVYGAM